MVAENLHLILCCFMQPGPGLYLTADFSTVFISLLLCSKHPWYRGLITGQVQSNLAAYELDVANARSAAVNGFHLMAKNTSCQLHPCKNFSETPTVKYWSSFFHPIPSVKLFLLRRPMLMNTMFAHWSLKKKRQLKFLVVLGA